MKDKHDLKNMTIKQILAKYPYAETFFAEQKFPLLNTELTVHQLYNQLSEDEREEIIVDEHKLFTNLLTFIENMQEFLGEKEEKVKTLSLLPGNNKKGEKEEFKRIDISSGEIVSIVGPTGSGKSRLLADIEWTAYGDTPTGRYVLINGERADKKWRLSGNKKLVAQLSQNMNFVMDLSVEDFLYLHAESRLIENKEQVVARIIEQANELAGEKFLLNTQVTSLSGGQSRALMIADTAILSSSPIVLIDEIENAGIDREKALELLVGEEKIVLMATHDPTLALMADKRIVINNGGIVEVIATTMKEKEILQDLQKYNQMFNTLREDLRYGNRILAFPAPVLLESVD